MLVDFHDLKAILDAIIARLDHCVINEVPPFTGINPTAEQIAQYIFTQLRKDAAFRKTNGARLASVKVWESETSSAEVNV